MEKYVIVKDPIYKMWVVWKREKNAQFETFKAKTKKECKKWLEENVK